MPKIYIRSAFLRICTNLRDNLRSLYSNAPTDLFSNTENHQRTFRKYTDNYKDSWDYPFKAIFMQTFMQNNTVTRIKQAGM
jgi:hypothetical protein